MKEEAKTVGLTRRRLLTGAAAIAAAAPLGGCDSLADDDRIGNFVHIKAFAKIADHYFNSFRQIAKCYFNLFCFVLFIAVLDGVGNRFPDGHIECVNRIIA